MRCAFWATFARFDAWRVDGRAPWADDARADHPAFIFLVVGQSRDDVLAGFRREAVIPARSLPPRVNNTVA
jgi:hypothetical protein